MVHDQQTFCQTKNSNFVDIFPFRRGRCSAARASEKSFLKKKERCFWGWKVEAEKLRVPSVEAEIFFLLRRIHQSNHHAFYKSEEFMANNMQIIHNYSTYVMIIWQVIKQFQTC